jgi:hypothetical protein
VGENICQLHIKAPITRIYREHKKLNSPQITDQLKKCATALNRTISKEEIQMTKKHIKKCSPSLGIKEMQIKTNHTKIPPHSC